MTIEAVEPLHRAVEASAPSQKEVETQSSEWRGVEASFEALEPSHKVVETQSLKLNQVSRKGWRRKDWNLKLNQVRKKG